MQNLHPLDDDDSSNQEPPTPSHAPPGVEGSVRNEGLHFRAQGSRRDDRLQDALAVRCFQRHLDLQRKSPALAGALEVQHGIGTQLFANDFLGLRSVRLVGSEIQNARKLVAAADLVLFKTPAVFREFFGHDVLAHAAPVLFVSNVLADDKRCRIALDHAAFQLAAELNAGLLRGACEYTLDRITGLNSGRREINPKGLVADESAFVAAPIQFQLDGNTAHGRLLYFAQLYDPTKVADWLVFESARGAVPCDNEHLLKSLLAKAL